MSGQIFISYRREESRWSARSLHDRLWRNFDPEQIFMDIDAIALGEDFVRAIETTVAKCDVLIAVIGNNWLTSKDDQGGRRLDNPEDFVRMEIATALKREIRVIPVLVDGALMPRSTELPDDLKPLVRRNALRISDTSFDGDCQRLVAAMKEVLEKAATERREREEQQTSTPSGKLEADKPATATPKVVSPFPPQPAEPKPVEPKPEKPPPSSSGGSGRKRLSKQLIIVLEVAAALLVGGLIYLAIRASQSPLPQPAPITAVTPSPPVIATPTVEEKALPTPKIAVQPSAQPTAPVAVAIPNPPISAMPRKEELARTAVQAATKDHPWVNSLGMNFVPVAGTQVLFSVWDTRVQDFETFVKSTGYKQTAGMWSLDKRGFEQGGATWKEPGFGQGPAHPVVGVSWNDAEEFCKWLTKRERSTGDLPQDREYRLPTDEEWSAAVGLKNEVGNTPEEKSGKIELYPWDIPQKRDKSWPPPDGAGNYRGEEVLNGDWPSGWPVIEGYNDGYPRTSPVGSFPANQFGLYDMGGNVWQWCADWYNSNMQYRVWRGASWEAFKREALLASYRRGVTPDTRNAIAGFRCVVAVESSR
jgi:formylglycine-generating enzyme required for sulfatase activity